MKVMVVYFTWDLMPFHPASFTEFKIPGFSFEKLFVSVSHGPDRLRWLKSKQGRSTWICSVADIGDSVKAIFTRAMSQGFDQVVLVPQSSHCNLEVATLVKECSGLVLGQFKRGRMQSLSVSMDALAKVPFERNSRDILFFNDLEEQFFRVRKLKAVRVTPARSPLASSWSSYVQYQFKIIKNEILSILGFYYEPKFDFGSAGDFQYTTKMASTSLHHFVRELPLSGRTILDFGGGDGSSASKFLAQKNQVVCLDQYPKSVSDQFEKVNCDLENDFTQSLGLRRFDTVLALDVIEHLKNPEESLSNLHKVTSKGGTLFASTGNIGFFLVRLFLFFGYFGYGEKGILDRTHRRLFSIYSFTRLIQNSEFKILRVIPFGAPIADLRPDSKFFRFLDRVSAALAKLWPGMFAFQFLVEAKRVDGLSELLTQTTELPPLPLEVH